MTQLNSVRILISVAINLQWPCNSWTSKMSFCMVTYRKRFIWINSISHQDMLCQGVKI